jgi:hypothetical protein
VEGVEDAADHRERPVHTHPNMGVPTTYPRRPDRSRTAFACGPLGHASQVDAWVRDILNGSAAYRFRGIPPQSLH